jgi:hypothetical protein
VTGIWSQFSLIPISTIVAGDSWEKIRVLLSLASEICSGRRGGSGEEVSPTWLYSLLGGRFCCRDGDALHAVAGVCGGGHGYDPRHHVAARVGAAGLGVGVLPSALPRTVTI